MNSLEIICEKSLKNNSKDPGNCPFHICIILSKDNKKLEINLGRGNKPKPFNLQHNHTINNVCIQILFLCFCDKLYCFLLITYN